MRITCLCLGFLFTILSSVAMAADGMVSVKSNLSAVETMDRVERFATERGLKVFARIDHAAGAASIGKQLRPTELIIFGNPKGGTPFMECQQTVGIDLPLKMLVWEDENADVWLGYNDPAFVAARHQADSCPVVENMQKALAALAESAISR
jgi:uncharacterized protein (DUF302 family)